MVRQRRDWAATLLRPQVLLAALALATALPYLLGAFGSRPVEANVPSLTDASAVAEARVEFEAPLVLYDLDGRPRATTASVRSADTSTARSAATLVALREALLDAGVWPPEVDAPRVAVYEAGRRRVAVVDVNVPSGVRSSVAAELAALRSMVETMRTAGADEVQVIVNGRPAATLWGNVALP